MSHSDNYGLVFYSRFGLMVTHWSRYTEVTLRQARLVAGWVTVLGRVNHLGAEPGTLA